MRTKSVWLAALFAGTAGFFGFNESAFAQVTLTVSPAIVSNTYSGTITLNITGLTNTEKVLIERFIDRNGNGTLDAADLLVDSFKIADGGAMVIGGVTNINAPFDSNPSPGAVTTSLNFVPALILDNIVGQQIFSVVSPSGRFAPVNAVLAVTNSTYNQSISGRVYSNGVAYPYAIVVMQDQRLNDTVAATVADASGHYSLPLPPSQYTPIAANPGFIYDFSTAPSINLTNGMTASADLFMATGSNTVSGNIYDLANTNPIGALMLTLQSGSQFAVAFTDANGNYAAPVTPSFWKIQPVKQRLTRRAYVLPESTFQVDATVGNVSNANIGLPKGTAIFYGRVTDNSNQPIANVEIDAGTGGSAANSFDAKGYSDPNGNFSAVALGDATNQWSCEINSAKNSIIANYIFNTWPTRSFMPGQAAQQNFIGLPVTATISGNVRNSLGAPVTGVSLTAGATIGGLSYESLDGTTDNSGNYTISVASGQWSVQFLTGGFTDNIDTQGYADLTAPHYVTVPPNNIVLNLTVYPIGTPLISNFHKTGPTQFTFEIFGSSNVTYTVQALQNLASTNWSNLLSFVLTNSSITVSDNNATNAARFYRVRMN